MGKHQQKTGVGLISRDVRFGGVHLKALQNADEIAYWLIEEQNQYLLQQLHSDVGHWKEDYS